MQIYRGDTFKFDFSATLEGSNELHTFEEGDILKAAIKSNVKDNNYILFQEKEIDVPTNEVTFEFTHTETIKIPLKKEAILEVELTNVSGKVSTLYQEEIEIVGDVIDE